MAQQSAAEQLFTNDAREKRREEAPRGSQHHSSREFNRALIKAQREGSSQNVLELGRQGPLGLDNAQRDRLLLKFPSADRDGIRAMVEAHNNYAQRGFDALAPAERTHANAVNQYALLNAGISGFAALAPADQETTATALLQDKEYRLIFNKRLKEVAGRDVNPTQQEVADRVAVLETNDMLDDRAINTHAASLIAAGKIDAGDIATRAGDILAVEPGLDVAVAAARAQDELAAERARRELIAADKKTITDRTKNILASPGALDAAAVDARRADIKRRNPAMPDADAHDQAREELATERARQELVTRRARDILIGDNQETLLNDMSEASLHSYAVNEIHANYDARADTVDRAALGNAVADKKLEELRARIRTYDPDAYQPGGAAHMDFQKFLEQGPSYLFERNPRDRASVADPEGWQMIMNNPELRRKFEQEAALELTMARLRVKNPPLSDADKGRMASSTAWGDTPLDRIQTIDQMFNTHQMFKDVREAGRAGGMLDRAHWDKVKDAVRNTKNPAIAAGIIAGIIAAMTGGLGLPVYAGVAIMGGMLAKYGQRQYQTDFSRNADKRVYEGA